MSSRETLFLSAAAFLIFCPLFAVIFLPARAAPDGSFFLHGQFRRFCRPSPSHVIAPLPHHPVYDTTHALHRRRRFRSFASSAYSVFISPPFSMLSYPRGRCMRIVYVRQCDSCRTIVLLCRRLSRFTPEYDRSPRHRFALCGCVCVCGVQIDLVV